MKLISLTFLSILNNTETYAWEINENCKSNMFCCVVLVLTFWSDSDHAILFHKYFCLLFLCKYYVLLSNILLKKSFCRCLILENIEDSFHFTFLREFSANIHTNVKNFIQMFLYQFILCKILTV